MSRKIQILCGFDMKIKKYKPKFAVLCRMIDCKEDWGLFLLGDDNPMVFDTKSAARKAMKRDYMRTAESYGASWRSGCKDPCKRTVLQDEISLDVPIYDAENDIESWIRLRWKIVDL